MEEPDFWNDPERSQELMKELKSKKDDVEIYQQLVSQMEDMELMIEMGYEENDPEVIPEIQELLDEFETSFENIRMKTLLSGEYDRDDAIVTLHAGAGGTDPPAPRDMRRPRPTARRACCRAARSSCRPEPEKRARRSGRTRSGRYSFSLCRPRP